MRNTGIRTINFLVFIIVVAFFAFPDLWLLFASVEKGATLNTNLPTFENITLLNHRHVVPILLTPLFNSLYICGLGTIITVITASIAAYPLSRYEFKLKWPIMYGMLFFLCPSNNSNDGSNL